MKKTTALFLFFFFISGAYSQSGWYWKAPYPQANPINKIFTVSSGKFFSAGNYGTLLTSTNSGANWVVANKLCGIQDAFRAYFIYDNNTIYLGTEGGDILKTTNGGGNWNFLTKPFSGNIISIDFRNMLTGYVCSSQKVYRTTDGGANWVQTINFNSSYISDMRFVTQDIGFVCSGGIVNDNPDYEFGILKTTNGGYNWTQVLSFSSGTIKNFCFIDQNTGFVRREELWFTTNQGINWSKYGTGSLSNVLESYQVFSINDAYAGTMQTHFAVTSNGGNNWTERVSPNYDLYEMSFLNMNTGYVLGWNNLIYRTSNAGYNWQQLTERNGGGTASDRLYDHCFIDQNTGFVVGWNGLIKKTTDQGETWVTIPSLSINNNASVEFINASTGFLGSYTAIYKSTNGGNNWFSHIPLNYSTARSIRFFNQSTGLYGLSSGAIYRTTDGGNAWTRVDSSLYYDFGGLEIVNSTTGYAYGNIAYTSGRILKTTNAGLNWTITCSSLYLSKLKFVNSLTGYAAGTGVIKTTDGGTTWARVLNTGYYFGIDFPSPNTGYIGGLSNGLPTVVCRTTNGGLLWNGLDCPQGGAIYGAKFFNDTVGIIYGENGAILKTYNGGGNIVSGTGRQGEVLPSEYALYQNYPNPFNPFTRIKFSIPMDSRIRGNDNVCLKVYDILGKEIATLVNERMQPGTYEVSFDGSGYPSGIYFYSFTSGIFSETKKMILIK